MTINIRSAEPSDFEAIREIMTQPQVQAQTMQLPYASLEFWKKRLAETPAGDHVLVAEVDGKVVGNLGLHCMPNRPRRRHVGAIGLVVHTEWHRRGVGRALMNAAIELADNWLQYTRLELTVFVDNAGALALYRNCGFEIEGTLRQYVFRDGKYIDAYSMARLKA